ncbi:Zinc finger MYM-type protein 1, partial [Clarias magur]
MDVLYCKKRIESLLAFVKEKRSEGAFQAVYAKTADLTSDPRDEPMRKRRLTQLQDPQERYRNLYMTILDNILEQIPRRFSNSERMLFLELANPEKFDDMRQVFPEEAFQSVLKNYGHHFDSGRLRSELQVLYSDQDLQDCSVERNTTCDSLGNATLDTAAFYEQYKDCDWSSRDREDIVLKLITPASNVNIQCILPEIRLKMQCDSPKRVEVMACYWFPTTGPNSAGE